MEGYAERGALQRDLVGHFRETAVLTELRFAAAEAGVRGADEVVVYDLLVRIEDVRRIGEVGELVDVERRARRD